MTSPATLFVNEIFASIQGESTWTGIPMAFVRLAGCPLRCSYCDTEYAFHEGRIMSLDEIVAQVARLGLKCVEITGGEPLAQPPCHELMTRLCDLDLTLLLETAGSHEIARVDRRVHIILDVKAPGSGEMQRMKWSNLEHLCATKDEVKFVLSGRADFDWALEIIQQHELSRRARAILLSPVTEKLAPRDLAAWILETRLFPPIRMQLQMHKTIWGSAQRGV